MTRYLHTQGQIFHHVNFIHNLAAHIIHHVDVIHNLADMHRPRVTVSTVFTSTLEVPVHAGAGSLALSACRPLPVHADAGALAVFALILVPPMNTPGMDALALVDGCARLASADDVAIDVDGLFGRERR